MIVEVWDKKTSAGNDDVSALFGDTTHILYLRCDRSVHRNCTNGSRMGCPGVRPSLDL